MTEPREWVPTPQEVALRRSFVKKSTAVLLGYLVPFAIGAIFFADSVALQVVLAAFMVVFVAMYLVSLATVEFVPPGFALIITGRRYRGPRDEPVGYRVVRKRATFRVPFVERAHRMDVQPFTVVVSATAPDSDGDMSLVEVAAKLKPSSSIDGFHRAVERSLAGTVPEQQELARQALVGALTATVADLTVEEINDDREQFGYLIEREAEDAAEELGLDVDSIQLNRFATRVAR